MGRISNKSIIGLVEDFVKDINKVYKIDKAILFGSRARDDWLYSSDIDLIIVSDDFEGIGFLDRISLIAHKWDNPIVLSPICYTRDEFNRKKEEIGLVKEADETGKEIAAA
jgi:uncharacterized protein